MLDCGGFSPGSIVMFTLASLARRHRTQAVVFTAAFLLTALLLCAKVAFGSGLKGFDAAGPNKDYPEKMMLYGRLVGDWKVDYTAYARWVEASDYDRGMALWLGARSPCYCRCVHHARRGGARQTWRPQGRVGRDSALLRSQD